ILAVWLFSFCTTVYAESLLESKKTAVKKLKNCSFKSVYPQFSPKNSSYSAGARKINRMLKKEFLNISAHFSESECEPEEKEGFYTLETDYFLKRNSRIVSILYISTGYKKDRPHPNNISKGFSFDAVTGKRISFSDLIQGQKALNLLQDLIISEISAMDIPFSEEIRKKEYDFYITESGVSFINLFQIHALQSVEAEIPFHRLEKILNVDKIR
ncbi:MAG TPA: hypothetical protein PL048_08805, partial [Leptospiraceae bacterium]|nr:hypothetical protein [Leptospiraceae bacterium]